MLQLKWNLWVQYKNYWINFLALCMKQKMGRS